VFILENRGKQSVCVDINRAEGAEIVKGLAAKADVVIENFGLLEIVWKLFGGF
jgi:crotonobetainyl-CoA:carnitine CoA-transferase CaiB-like acyl-CoA transferase